MPQWRNYQAKPIVVKAYQDDEGGVITGNDKMPDTIVSPGDYIVQAGDGKKVVVPKLQFESGYELLIEYRPLVVVFFGETGPVKSHITTKFGEKVSRHCRVGEVGVLDFPKNIYALMSPKDDVETPKYRRWLSRYYKSHPFVYLANMWAEKARSAIFDVITVPDAHTWKEWEWADSNIWRKVLCDVPGDGIARWSFLERRARRLRNRYEGWDARIKAKTVGSCGLEPQIDGLVEAAHGWFVEHQKQLEATT